MSTRQELVSTARSALCEAIMALEDALEISRTDDVWDAAVHVARALDTFNNESEC